MRKFVNEVFICGDLVENKLKEDTDKNGNDVINGSLILRTADKSEHIVNYYCSRFKTDSDGNVIGEERKSYKDLREALSYKDMKHCEEGEHPDVVTTFKARFDDGTYCPKGSTNVFEGVRISAQGAYLVSPSDYDSTEKTATYRVEGIIESIEEEMKGDDVTGNLEIKMNLLSQRNDDYRNANTFEATALFPIRLIVLKDLAEAFTQTGYYEGCVTDFTGVVVNIRKVEKFTEKRAFGNDVVNTRNVTVHRFEIETGGKYKSIYELDLNDDTINALIEKRKMKIKELKEGRNSNNGGFSKAATEAPKMSSNPFNPFAKK